jgi:hypothetical protein
LCVAAASRSSRGSVALVVDRARRRLLWEPIMFDAFVALFQLLGGSFGVAFLALLSDLLAALFRA